MLKAALIGIGTMGKGHLNNYVKLLEEKSDIQLVAICDIDEKKFANTENQLNISSVEVGQFDFSKFHCYTSVDELLKNEELDMVSVVVPTYAHCEVACKCLNAGIHVFCEKPMALNVEQCQLMIDTAKKNNKKLMIGHCLRFWGEYEFVKQCIEDQRYGKPVSAYLFRGGDTPKWSYNDWLHKRELGGGAVFDQHVHDVDSVNFFFGMPKAVSTIGKTVYPGSGYDMVSTNYFYEDGKVVNTQNDWSMRGNNFRMEFRINFEKGSVYYVPDGFKVAGEGESFHKPEYEGGDAYMKEIRYFADCIINNKDVTVNTPEDSMRTIKIVTAEIASADNGGKITEVR